MEYLLYTSIILSMLHTLPPLILKHLYERSTVIIPTLQMWKLRHRAVKSLAHICLKSHSCEMAEMELDPLALSHIFTAFRGCGKDFELNSGIQ